MAIERVEPGRPPLLWSEIQQAFNLINQNFTELDARTDDGSSGGVNFSALFTDVTPAVTGEFNLGQSNKTWKSLFLAQTNNAEGNDVNGLWIGSGQISGIDGKVNLPAASTLDYELIINPDNTFFKTFSVNGEDNVIAASFADTIEFAGNGINISTDSANKIINFLNAGVLSVAGTAGQIGVNVSTGDIVLTNLGVLQVDNDNYSPASPVADPSLSFNNRAPGAGIVVSNSTGNITLTNTGVLSIVSGSAGILVQYEPTTGAAIVSNTAPNVAQNTFRSISKFGQGIAITATSTGDVLNLEEGYGLILNFDPVNKRITFDLDQKIDITGSVFADNSTLLVDAVNGSIPYSVLSESPTALSEFSNDLDYPTIITTTIQSVGLPQAELKGNLLDSTGLSVIINPATKEIFGQLIGSLKGDVTGDVVGSVFGDDSFMIINGIDGKVVGPVDTTIVTTEKTIKKTAELTGATGIFAHNCANSHIFVHTDISTNFNVNLINFEIQVGESTTITTILVQGTTGHTIDGFRINGVTQSLYWVNGVQPSGTANRRDIVEFNILRRVEGYTVYGELKSFVLI